MSALLLIHVLSHFVFPGKQNINFNGGCGCGGSQNLECIEIKLIWWL